MKKIIVLFLLIIAIPGFSQKKHLKTYMFEGSFAYEADDKLRSLDDMIYRKSAMVFAKKNKVQCNNSIFIFETSTIGIDLSNFNDEEKDKIKKASNFFNDSIHDLFQTKHTKIVFQKGFEYKLFDVKFKALYLGKLKHPIRKNNKFLDRKMHTYLIYDFIKIITIP